MNYWLGCFKKYAEFSGRARRQEYWMFILFNMLVCFGLQIVDVILGTEGVLGAGYSLAALIPSWAVFTRRMHDIGKSGWWWLVGLVPIVGQLCCSYLCVWTVSLVTMLTDRIQREFD